MSRPARSGPGPDWARRTTTTCEAETCRYCDRRLNQFGRCRARSCPAYFKLWAGDQAKCIRANVGHLATVGNGCDLITVTAPGVDTLPWDRSRCRHPEGVPCSGRNGCVTDPTALAAWHTSCFAQYDRLMRAAMARVSRAGYKRPRHVAAPELQNRGAIHWHIATAVTDRRAARELYAALLELAPVYGYGRRVGWDPFRGEDGPSGGATERLSRYMAKLAGYMAKAHDGDTRARADLTELLQVMGRRRVVRVSPKLTRETRVTMTNLRLVRFCFCMGIVPPPGTYLAAAEAERLAPMLRAQMEAALLNWQAAKLELIRTSS